MTLGPARGGAIIGVGDRMWGWDGVGMGGESEGGTESKKYKVPVTAFN